MGHAVSQLNEFACQLIDDDELASELREYLTCVPNTHVRSFTWLLPSIRISLYVQVLAGPG